MKQSLPPVIWLTGNSGAGKTTLAQGFERHWNENDSSHPWSRRVITLDGDEMRSTISVGLSLSPDDRRTHNVKVAKLAALMRAKGFVVIVAVIAPFREVRKEIDAVCRPLWIYVKRSGLEAPDRPYEEPVSPDFVINTDVLGKAEALQSLLSFMKGHETGELLRQAPKKSKKLSVKP